MMSNLHSGTESQPPIEAIEHLIAEHICRFLSHGCSFIGSNGFRGLAKQTDVKIRSGLDEQTDILSYGKLITDMDGNIQIVRSTLIG